MASPEVRSVFIDHLHSSHNRSQHTPSDKTELRLSDYDSCFTWKMFKYLVLKFENLTWYDQKFDSYFMSNWKDSFFETQYFRTKGRLLCWFEPLKINPHFFCPFLSRLISLSVAPSLLSGQKCLWACNAPQCRTCLSHTIKVAQW